MLKCVTSLPCVPAMVWGLVTEKEIPAIQEPLHLHKNECHSYIIRWNVNYFLNVSFFSPSKFPGTSGKKATDGDGTQIYHYFPKSPSLHYPYWDVYNHAGRASPTWEHSNSTSPCFDITFMPATCRGVRSVLASTSPGLILNQVTPSLPPLWVPFLLCPWVVRD